jgi:hypothetical protein
MSHERLTDKYRVRAFDMGNGETIECVLDRNSFDFGTYDIWWELCWVGGVEPYVLDREDAKRRLKCR